MSKLRTIAVLPTLFTLGNLFCGFFAIVVIARVESPTSKEVPKAAKIGMVSPMKAFKEFDPDDPSHNLMLAGWLIFLAMIFDAVDGRVARLSKSNSDFGVELDSLCDLVSFGVAPALMLVKMCPSFAFLHKEAVWTIAAAFAGCAAMRLARYNVESDEEDDHMSFSGLPSPAAAAAIGSFAIMFYSLRLEEPPINPDYAAKIDTVMQTILPFLGVLLGIFMVSRIPYPHFTNQVLRGQRSMGHIVAVLFCLVAIFAIRGFAVPLLCNIFVLTGPVRFLWKVAVQRRPQEEPLF